MIIDLPLWADVIVWTVAVAAFVVAPIAIPTVLAVGAYRRLPPDPPRRPASILTPAQEHARYCGSPAHDVADWGRPGDVRRCPMHGRAQVGYEVPGVVPPYWRDLSPLWTPLAWRRARRALASVGERLVGQQPTRVHNVRMSSEQQPAPAPAVNRDPVGVHSHRAVIQDDTAAPVLTMIASGPEDYCLEHLTRWIDAHPLGEHQQAIVLEVVAVLP